MRIQKDSDIPEYPEAAIVDDDTNSYACGIWFKHESRVYYIYLFDLVDLNEICYKSRSTSEKISMELVTLFNGSIGSVWTYEHDLLEKFPSIINYLMESIL